MTRAAIGGAVVPAGAVAVEVEEAAAAGVVAEVVEVPDENRHRIVRHGHSDRQSRRPQAVSKTVGC